MKLNTIPLSSKHFSVNLKNSHKGIIKLVAEASSLRDMHLQRLYDDACDLGFSIRSERTGVVITYVLHSENINDGEIVSWIFTPISECIRKHPTCANTLVMVIND